MNVRTGLLCIFAVISVASGFRIRVNEETSCVKCHDTDENKINVHLVHHSHDDVGWLKTVDQYYWGLNYTIVNVGVQYIITSVVNALWDHPERRFIQVETGFFWMWWKNQDEVMRNKMKTLVENGQLEIINGGYVMNDEACVNYQSTIDQFTWGFRVLDETLGKCGMPTIGWQIDPFGHSREHASILSKIGFDGLFFARLDNNDRETRKNESNMDFLWKTSANKDDSVIFGSMFGPDNIYYPPSGFCFDVLCGDDSIDDDVTNDAYNLEKKVADFAAYIKSYTKYYKTKNILITMGGDFQYQAAEINFQNSDKLIRAFENHTEIKLLYSTPSCYLKEVYKIKPSLVTKTDDFFPYGSADHTYWAGYFTSRQNFKRFERISHNVLQVAKQVSALALASNKNVSVEPINRLSEAMSIVQHHDAITGTEKQHVAHDYTKILSRAVTQVENKFTETIGKHLLGIDLSSYTTLSSCHLANMSICAVTQTADQFVVVIYNPLSWVVNQTVRLPVENGSYTVSSSDGNLSHDVLSPINDFSYVTLKNVTPAKRELVFIASNLPPFGVRSYYVSKVAEETGNNIYQNLDNILKFGNENIGFEISNDTNLLKSVTMNGKTLEITQTFLHYVSHNGTNDTDPSGAYIFRPDGEAIPYKNVQIISKIQGDVVDEVHQKFDDGITQIIRVYKGSQNYIEFDWLVGPLDISDKRGIEIISRFTVQNFNNNQKFYTDSNGREMIERILNYRPTYSYNHTYEPIASNYYPVTSNILIRDEKQNLEVAILNDRSQGGSSLAEGEIELMVHRRMLKDDNKGVDEPLNETEFGQGIVARGQHYLVLGPSSDILSDGKTVRAQERILAQTMLQQPWIGVADASKIPEDEVNKLLTTTYTALKQPTPANINILTFEPWTNSSYLLRLEHILEKDEDPNLSSPVRIDIEDLFASIKVTDIIETTLGGNRKLDLAKPKFDWSYENHNIYNNAIRKDGQGVTLEPMDIKTFIIQVSNN
ncbi:lysosomal alpha-mannosidase-like [Anthonomus grandis grandis]|uniref:lysosomal alpha-mannosidase-like n=1 Tax=Anthonomus grandis grandis TaxID=2921223 RepID=UPI0021663283|nr:lysosomal alpha-mannosidase-like [Anthonomus grandis grandis]